MLFCFKNMQLGVGIQLNYQSVVGHLPSKVPDPGFHLQGQVGRGGGGGGGRDIQFHSGRKQSSSIFQLKCVSFTCDFQGFLKCVKGTPTSETHRGMFSPCRPFTCPQLTCVKMAGSVLPQIAVLVSPKNKQTPFAESEVVRTAGRCWESDPGPQGKQCEDAQLWKRLRRCCQNFYTVFLLLIGQELEDVWKSVS